MNIKLLFAENCHVKNSKLILDFNFVLPNISFWENVKLFAIKSKAQNLRENYYDHEKYSKEITHHENIIEERQCHKPDIKNVEWYSILTPMKITIFSDGLA